MLIYTFTSNVASSIISFVFTVLSGYLKDFVVRMVYYATRDRFRTVHDDGTALFQLQLAVMYYFKYSQNYFLSFAQISVRSMGRTMLNMSFNFVPLFYTLSKLSESAYANGRHKMMIKHGERNFSGQDSHDSTLTYTLAVYREDVAVELGVEVLAQIAPTTPAIRFGSTAKLIFDK